MSNIFFTSDTHFGHSKIIKYCPDSRGHFDDVDQMNQYLINQWNSVVNSNDIVYHLGDVAFAKAEIVKNIFNELNGKIILVPGNHDKKLLKKQDFVNCFDDIICASYLETKIDGEFVVMSHYPIAR